ncbi:MAG TPA: 16S rRNA (uracil(1498)-N(3))-methyltransferase [Microvirga sp.]|jgi:16S rRNA (uracil1498-N3)-methyltransferase|nr:16S rRNA (uracil(1498)-N(3))-methyltransferase [Microvirga sp.]
MALYAFDAPRLFVEDALSAGARIALDRAQANYLLNVLRLRTGESVLAFNGRDGEWRVEVEAEGRKSAALVARELTRPQAPAPDLLYLFAPLKHARLDYMVQKAVEMGAGALRPVFTRRTQSQRVNLERMRANAIEAAEQCGILALPAILEEASLPQALAALEPDRLLVFCDEDAPLTNPVEALAGARAVLRGGNAAPASPVAALAGDAAKLAAEPRNPAAKLAVVIGPEGGFTDEERALVAAHSPCVRVSLGPRILRADTAAVAALALVQAVLGDWR